MPPRQTVILAAGQGTRLRPLTDDLPKCLVEVAGRSLLERQLGHLAHHPGMAVCIVTGFKEEKIQSCLARSSPDGRVHTCTNPRFATTNNAYSLWLALREHPGPFLLMDGDLLYDPLLLDRLVNDPRADLIVVDTDRTRLNPEAMKVCFDVNRSISALSKEIPLNRAYGESIGMGKFSAAWAEKILQSLSKKMADPVHHQIYYEDVIAPLLQEAPPLGILPTEELRWEEVDTPEDLARATRLWSQ